MAPAHSAARTEREKKLRALLSFATSLTDRFNSSTRDTALVEDLQVHIRGLPFPSSSAISAKQDELDRIGTELWNLSTRLRRDDTEPNSKNKDATKRMNTMLCLLRVFAFMLLDMADSQANKGRERKTCVRLMRVALKAARVCVENNELSNATKVLERAAGYEDALSKGKEPIGEKNEEANIEQRLRVEYFAVRTALAWRQDRMDMAEHMFSKSRQLNCRLFPSTAETLADLFYEMGEGLLRKQSYELAVRWLQRAYDVLGEQELELLSSEASELRQSTMQSLISAYMKLKTEESQRKAWAMMSILDIDYSEKMSVSLLKLELLSSATHFDAGKYCTILLRMIHSVVMNETIFKTIMHHIHKLNAHSKVSACKILDDLIRLRLFREENQSWIEKALTTRLWVETTSQYPGNGPESLQELFDSIVMKTKNTLSPPATHAAQTLLWKRVEVAFGQEQYAVAEAWCNICLHQLFEKAGELNKAKIARRVILCALSRQDYAAARGVFSKMSDVGRNEPITRYLMYKAALHDGDAEFSTQCLEVVSKQSSNDATLLYACVLEAQSAGEKRQAIFALEKVLEKYEYSAPAGIHLPALLRCTARLLSSEIVREGSVRRTCAQAKAIRRRPAIASQQLFTPSEFEWFSKNSYNLCLKYCTEMQPSHLVRLLTICIEFITLLKEQNGYDGKASLPLREVFCHFLAACALTTLARAEDNIQKFLQHYLNARKHCQDFRRLTAEDIKLDNFGDSARADLIAKHFQIVKLELEALLKLENWEALDELFEECWRYKNPAHYETLADLVLVIHSSVVKANADVKYQAKLLSVIQKIINLTWHQSNNDISKLSRWVRCLFRLALGFDETISLRCLDQASQVAAARQGVSLADVLASIPSTLPPSSSPSKSADFGVKGSDPYPAFELEYLATTSFNHAVDYYLANDVARCKAWAEKAFAVAQWADDRGQLRGLLMKKYSDLSWDA
ncbi:SPO22-domain-containing protein [Lojkania enalia]|uniref:Protein ZIP4 homolog n=1 Tax=Lojkania enalia TaxID=147567 RepID=A0A9P4K348_9PLEO|nr:SPO22-domain-containing protein [Didymosphaeria enalia]